MKNLKVRPNYCESAVIAKLNAMMSPTFRQHQGICVLCARIDPTNIATFGQGCAIGGRMISEEAMSVKRERIPRPENWCSKERLKKLMIYKEGS